MIHDSAKVRKAKPSNMARPRYLLRKSLMLREVDKVRPRTILEIGFGAGDLLLELGAKGYGVTGIDYSAEAVDHVKRISPGIDVRLVSDAGFAREGLSYDMVIASEVLEHVEDDISALERWKDLLLPGGRLMISVPAHMRRWGPNDDYHGHLRRYSRAELRTKMRKAGFRRSEVLCYGFPLANIAGLIGERMIRKREDDALSQVAKTKRSGLAYPSFGAASILINQWTVFPFTIIQRIFLDTELGPGFICIATR